MQKTMKITDDTFELKIKYNLAINFTKFSKQTIHNTIHHGYITQ